MTVLAMLENPPRRQPRRAPSVPVLRLGNRQMSNSKALFLRLHRLPWRPSSASKAIH